MTSPPRGRRLLTESNGALYALTVLIWGSTWYAISFQLGSVQPMVSVAWRYLLAAAILLVFCVSTRRRLRRHHRSRSLVGNSAFKMACLPGSEAVDQRKSSKPSYPFAATSSHFCT